MIGMSKAGNILMVLQSLMFRMARPDESRSRLLTSGYPDERVTRLTTSPRLFALLTVSIVFTNEAKIETGHNINKTARYFLAA